MARDLGDIFETWVFIFSTKYTIFFQISIKVTFWLINIEKYALSLKQLSSAQPGNFLNHEEEFVFEKILSVESILGQFFIKFQFHVLI